MSEPGSVSTAFAIFHAALNGAGNKKVGYKEERQETGKTLIGAQVVKEFAHAVLLS